MALKFIDIDPRIPFGLISTFNLAHLAERAIAAARRSFSIRVVEPSWVTAERNKNDDEDEVAQTYETGFVLVPLTKVRPDGLIARGYRVESSNLIEANAIAHHMFEWSRDA